MRRSHHYVTLESSTKILHDVKKEFLICHKLQKETSSELDYQILDARLSILKNAIKELEQRIKELELNKIYQEAKERLDKEINRQMKEYK
jgi:hypothetical protein